MGIKERHDRERHAVRQSILDAARELFVTEGYRNVSIRKIAERIEYSPAAIYSYFAGKDEIYFSLAEDGFRLLHATLLATPSSGSPLEQVRGDWLTFYRFSREQSAYFELMFVDRSVPQITEGWQGLELVTALMGDATARLQAAIDAGELPADLNPLAAMHVLWAALTGPSVLALCDRLSPDEDRDLLARDVLDAVLAGLKAGSGTTFVPDECRIDPDAAASAGESPDEA
ncbi:MAG: TetR/AcrR family transcriptional regulator [Acidobacteria bacterium]|nr:TetR/AcrR family transcriptional regulator [Acidobacteriota bacterium]